jgi:hypothetical protein
MCVNADSSTSEMMAFFCQINELLVATLQKTDVPPLWKQLVLRDSLGTVVVIKFLKVLNSSPLLLQFTDA